MEADMTVANGGQTRRNASPANAAKITATTPSQPQLTRAGRGRAEAHRPVPIRARGNPSEGSARSVVGCSTAKGGGSAARGGRADPPRVSAYEARSTVVTNAGQ
jgi:hypothetical protein